MRSFFPPSGGTDCTQILELRIAAKPLQLTAWVLLNHIPSPTSYGHLLSQNRCPYAQNLHGALRTNCISGMVAVNRLQTFANVLSNASTADHPLLLQTGVLTPRPDRWLASCNYCQPHTNALSSSRIADPLYGHLFSQNRGPEPPSFRPTPIKTILHVTGPYGRLSYSYS